MRSRILASVRRDAEALMPGHARAQPDPMPSRRALADVLMLFGAAALGALAMFVALDGGRRENLSGIHASGPSAVLHRAGGRAEIVVSGMSEPPAGQIYELWTERPGRAPHPTDALFTVTSAGNGTVEVPGGLRGVSAVMVTREPRGGSSTPSGPPVLRIAVDHGARAHDS